MSTIEWNAAMPASGAPTGTHIPFTASLLAGVCGRLAGRRLDFIMPNPAGRRGHYIEDWRRIADFGAPTVHDTVLAARLAALPALDPARVREAARAVAIEGYAGPKAAAAARAARRDLDRETHRLRSRLLLALIRLPAVAPDQAILLRHRLDTAEPAMIDDALGTVAPQIGWAPAALVAAVDALSAAYAPLCPNGRQPALLALLDRTARGLAETAAQRAESGAPPVAALHGVAEALLRCLGRGRHLAAAADSRLSRPTALLEAYRHDPQAALRPVRALDRALDGWDRICLLWQDCGAHAARLAALPQLAVLAGLADARGTQGAQDGEGDADAPDIGADAAPAEALVAGRPSPALMMPGPAMPGPLLVERHERVRAAELALDSADA